MRAALLDASVYEEIEADRSATPQAIAVVVLSSIAAGIGGAAWEGPRLTTLLVVAAVALVTWVAWAMLVLKIGTGWLPEADTRSNLGEMARTIGFSATPGLLQVFAVLPTITVAVYVITWAWMFAAMVIAIRQALDYRSTGRAVAVSALALSLVLAMLVVLGVLFGPSAS
jgi:hypothetical protein